MHPTMNVEECLLIQKLRRIFIMKYLGLKDEKWLRSDVVLPLNHAKDGVGSCDYFLRLSFLMFQSIFLSQCKRFS